MLNNEIKSEVTDTSKVRNETGRNSTDNVSLKLTSLPGSKTLGPMIDEDGFMTVQKKIRTKYTKVKD